MAELCRKAGFASSQNIVQRDLEFLCDSIESKTGVLISLSTIKRLLNGQFSRLPQIATLNAITSFIGYANWQEFKSTLSTNENELAANGSLFHEEVLERKPRSSRFFHNKFLVPGGLLACAAVGLFFIIKPEKPKAGNFEKAQFAVDKTTSNDIPNTVVFKYDISKVNADSFFIQQSWDRNRRVRIDKNSNTLTDIYYEPGYHVAKLIANDSIIKTLDVSIPTDRWFFYVKEKKPGGSLPQYIITQSPFKEGSLKLDKEEVTGSGVDIKKQQVYVQVYFPGKFENSSDNFILKTRVRVNDLNNNFCPFLMSEIFCQKNFMYFISNPKGCTSELSAQFSEKILSGKTNDLSALGANVKEWQDIEFIVKDKKVNIRINNVEVFSGVYTESAGLITGFGFVSNGLPEVDFISLENANGSVIYSNQF